MKCPHCLREGRSKVLESRPSDGHVWRRRMCLLCFATYVSEERAHLDMKMPKKTRSQYRLKDRKPKPEEMKREITSDGKDLQDLWR